LFLGPQVDLAIESGEYFLKPKEKEARERKRKQVRTVNQRLVNKDCTDR